MLTVLVAEAFISINSTSKIGMHVESRSGIGYESATGMSLLFEAESFNDTTALHVGKYLLWVKDYFLPSGVVEIKHRIIIINLF